MLVGFRRVCPNNDEIVIEEEARCLILCLKPGLHPSVGWSGLHSRPISVYNLAQVQAYYISFFLARSLPFLHLFSRKYICHIYIID